MARRSKKSENKYPKPLSSRFTDETVARLERVVQALTDKLKTRMKKSNVIQICVASHLPAMEKELGIAGK